MAYLLAALGGALGALARWGVAVALPFSPGDWPWATLLVNLTGCLLLGGLTWGGGPAGVAGLTLQLAVLTLATGGVFAAMILGHWYLVTPKLPEAPLILFSRVLTGAVAVQIVLFVAWLAVGAGPEGSPLFGGLTGSSALCASATLALGFSLLARA